MDWTQICEEYNFLYKLAAVYIDYLVRNWTNTWSFRSQSLFSWSSIKSKEDTVTIAQNRWMVAHSRAKHVSGWKLILFTDQTGARPPAGLHYCWNMCLYLDLLRYFHKRIRDWGLHDPSSVHPKAYPDRQQWWWGVWCCYWVAVCACMAEMLKYNFN